MRKRMTPEEQVEFLKQASERQDTNMRRYLQVPVIRHAVRRPAPGQDDCTQKMEHIQAKVKLGAC